MSKQTRCGFIMTLVVLFAFPAEASAGPFGFFKRCRVKRVVCCPPPTCEPIVVEASEPQALNKDATAEVSVTTWYAVGSGMSGSGPCSFTGECKPSPSEAIASAMSNAGGCNAFSYVLHLCPEGTNAIAPIEARAAETVVPNTETWRGYVTALNPAGQPVIRRTTIKYSTPGVAVDNAQGLVESGWTVLNYIVRKE